MGDQPQSEAKSTYGSVGSGALSFVTFAVSGTITAFLGGVLTVLATPYLQTESNRWPALVITIYFLIGCVVAARYWMVLGYGAFPTGSAQRRQYNSLRYELQTGGKVSQTYERMMRATLNGFDRAFGDSGAPQEIPLPKLMRLKEPAPLWTSESYDRCLLFAVVYPCLIIVGAWTLSGHVGPIEAALRLPANAGIIQRGVAAVGLLVLLGSWVQFMRQDDARRQTKWACITIVSLVITMVAGNASADVVAFAFSLAAAFALGAGIVVNRTGVRAINSAGAGTAAFATTGGLIIGLAGPTVAQGGGFQFTLGAIGLILAYVFAFAISVLIGVALVVSRRRGQLGKFLIAWTATVVFLAFASPVFLASLPSWPAAGPVLLFLVLLTVVNAPFDWLTLGLTRLLFRRGLEIGGWAPLVAGVADLLVAVLVVAVLAFVTVFSVQMFEELALLSGATPIVRIGDILHDLANPERRWRPEYAWIYAMLFWTLLPSVINIALGSLSVLRGIPGLNGLIAKRMPRGRPVLESERIWMVPFLTFQAMLSGFVGLAVVGAVFWALWSFEVPILGSMLSRLQSAADTNLPLELLRRLGALG